MFEWRREFLVAWRSIALTTNTLRRRRERASTRPVQMLRATFFIEFHCIASRYQSQSHMSSHLHRPEALVAAAAAGVLVFAGARALVHRSYRDYYIVEIDITDDSMQYVECSSLDPLSELLYASNMMPFRSLLQLVRVCRLPPSVPPSPSPPIADVAPHTRCRAHHTRRRLRVSLRNHFISNPAHAPPPSRPPASPGRC